MCVCDGVMDVSESLSLCGVQVGDTLCKLNSVVAAVVSSVLQCVAVCCSVLLLL